jgi:hypothetical protein
VRVLLILILFVNTAFAEEDKTRWIEKRKAILESDTNFYFYQGLKYGSQSLYNPLYLIVNGGYDIYQLDGHPRDMFRFNYAANAGNVFRNLVNPVPAIRDAGVKTFLTTEVFPLNFTREGAQWVPNYTLHIFGGGMSYRMMTEWYRYHNVRKPKLMSLLTVWTMHFMNEVVENANHQGTNLDPIADVFIFNVAGILLFNSIKVSRFFSETLHMADWSLQPSITFPDFRLHNNGHYVSLKYYMPFYEKIGLFGRMGMGFLGGLSYRINDELTLHGGMGIRSGQLVLLQEAARLVTIETKLSGGLFLEKNNSLLASIQISDVHEYFINANVYPGVIRIKNFSTGLWANVAKDGNTSFGICTRYTLGMGIGYTTYR